MKKIAIAVLSFMAASAYADDVNATMASIQSQLNQISAELNSQSQQQPMAGIPFVGTDAVNPLSAMSKVQMPINVLRAKNQLNNPVVIGGEIETDLQDTGGDTIPLKHSTNYDFTSYQQGSDIALSKVYLMTMVNFNDYVTGLVNIKTQLPLSNGLTVERAFLMFGNLNKSPFSLMVGANYLPFGNFAGNGPWSNALTTNMFRVSTTNQIIANFSNKWLIVNTGIYSNKGAGYNGVSYLANAIAQNTWRGIGMSFGVGYMNNVNGSNSSLGNAYTHATSPGSGQLTGGTNGAYDINASIGPAYFTLLGEYVSTTRGATSIGQNTGAMSAWMVGEQSTFKVHQIPTKFQLSYSQTNNMNNLQMTYNADIPQNLVTNAGIKSQWLTSIQGEFFPNVWVGPEFVTAHLYSSQNSYTGTLDMTAYF